MNLKKNLSGILAFAMATSAFAGFSITANAKTATASYNFEDGNVLFTGDSRITPAIESDSTLNSNVVGFTCAGNAQNGYSFAHYDFSALVEGAVSTTIEFDYYNTNGGRAIVTLGDASVRGNTGGSSKTTYSNTGAVFNLGSDKTNSIVNDAKFALADYTNKWMHVSVTVDETTDKYTYVVSDKATGAVLTQSAAGSTAAFVNSNAAALSQIDVFGYINNSHCAMIDNISITAEISEITIHDITYVVDGATTSEGVFEGSKPERIPTETTKTGYLFMGWTTDGDAEYDESKTYLSSEGLAQVTVTESVTYTAVYQKDPDYIEPIVSASITGPDSMTIGADADTAAANEYSVKLVGELGTVITAENIDSRIEDFGIEWDIKGFKTENDVADNSYCDYYGSFEAKTTDDVTTVFNLRKNASMNFYGLLTATVTYNGTTTEATKGVAAISNTDVPSNQVLPEAGYPSDMDDYSDALIGYESLKETTSGNDIIFGGWNMSGSDSKKSAILSSDATGKFLRISGADLKKSKVFTNSINTPESQVIFEQDMRFNNAGASITFTAGNPFWLDKNYSEAVVVNYDGTNLLLNSVAAAMDDQAVALTTNKWYKIVLSVDKTNETAFVYVYDNGELIAKTDSVAWITSCAPTYYGFALGNSNTGSLDVGSYKAYYPVADESTYTLVTTMDTLSIPNGDSAELTASLKTAEGYDLTGAATWTVLEEDMQEGVIVTPDATDSHKAVVTLAETAVAGEATVQVNIGGYTKTVKLNITSSAESVKFTESSTSVSIPLDSAKTTTVQYSAIVINGDGEDLERDVTLAVYDKTNSEAYTLPEGITFDAETGKLSVTADARACTFVIRATGANTDGEAISKSVKVTVHGLAFDFGAGTDEDLVEGYTAVTPDTGYTESRGYGITGTATAGGSASIEDANADYLAGAVVFKADVQAAKFYTVEIAYQGTLMAEPVNNELTAYTLGSQETLATATYTVPVVDNVLELSLSDYAPEDGSTVKAQIASIVITKEADRVAAAKPTMRAIGDSTLSNNGSWAYYITHNTAEFEDLYALVDFNANGRGGSNLHKYYTSGDFVNVLRSIKPGDIVMLGNMGTNGGATTLYRDNFNYYLDAFEAFGAKVMINSYTPHGPMGGYESGYDSTTQTFNAYRKDTYDNIVREIAAEREANDENYLGFVDIGKRADAAFNAYIDDYAANGYADRNAAAQAIIACFPDHNHYNGLATQLIDKGYTSVDGAVTVSGTVAGIIEVVAPYVNGGGDVEPETHTVTFDAANATVTVDGEAVTSTTVEAGNTVSFTVTAAEGYEVTSVKAGDDELTAEDGVYTITVNSDVTVTVAATVLSPAPTYGITYDDGVITILTGEAYEAASVFVVTYNEDGSLASVKLETVDLTADEAATVEIELAEGAKVMLWNGLNPIFDMFEI